MDLQIFRNNGWEIRTIEKDGEPWLIVKDVCESLHLSNVSETLKNVDAEDKFQLSTNIINPEVGGRGTWIINESGLYTIVLRSRKEEGKPFRRWVTSEVIPSIRKTGSYDFKVPTTLGDALQLAADQAKQLEEQRPKVEFHDAVAIADDCVDVGGMAKLTKKLGRNKLFSVMRFNGILMHDNTPYQTFINRGYFKVVEKRSEKPVGFAIYLVTVVTGKGQSYIIKNLDQWLRNCEEA